MTPLRKTAFRLAPWAVACLGLILAPSSPRAQGRDQAQFGVFVQTDSRGELRPCHCPGKTINGLGRRKGVFSMARALQYPVTILDGGDFLPDREDTLHTELRGLMLEAMERMRYDAVAVGERDLFPGPDFLRAVAAAVPLVCANLQTGPELAVDIPPVRWLEVEGTRVALTAFLDPMLFYTAPDAFDLYGEQLVILDPAESLTGLMKTVRSEADIVILLAHASIEEIDSLLERVPGFDVVVQGHEPMSPHPGTPYGDGFLVVPEPRSRLVSQLTLTLTDPLRKSVARTWDLKQTRYGDEHLDALVRAFEERHGLH